MGEKGRHAKGIDDRRKRGYSESGEYRESNRNRKKKRTIQNILLAIFIITFVVSGIILANWYMRMGNAEEKYEELAELYTNTNDDGEDEGVSNIVDFEQLEDINSDIVAWIKIDNTSINYPVMQTTDNSYYLSKNFYKEDESSGSIFMDYRSKITDKNIVVYGHNIKKGTMFADLVNIYEGDLGTDVNIYLYTSDRMMKFKVFSSYCTTQEEYSVDTTISKSNFKEFKQTVAEKSEIEFTGNYETASQIITLYTCNNSGKKRIIVHAELEKVVFFNEE